MRNAQLIEHVRICAGQISEYELRLGDTPQNGLKDIRRSKIVRSSAYQVQLLRLQRLANRGSDALECSSERHQHKAGRFVRILVFAQCIFRVDARHSFLGRANASLRGRGRYRSPCTRLFK